MTIEQELTKFWEREFKPRFDPNTLDFQVTLSNGTETRYVNLDNAATTVPFIRVLDEIRSESETYGSVHRGAGEKSRISTDRYEESRATVREFVNGRDSDYVVFSQNTTTAMNHLAHLFSNIRGKVLVSDIEHSSSFLPWIFQEGFRTSTVQVSLDDVLKGDAECVNEGILSNGRSRIIKYNTKDGFEFDLENIEEIFRDQQSLGPDERIKALVVTGASNVTGYRPPIAELSDIAHRYGATIVVDCCQLLQHEQMDMQSDGIDFIAFSGHKMYAPFGTGVIVGNRALFDNLLQYQIGGGNLPYITGDGEVIRHKTEEANDPGTPNFFGARAIHHAIRELDDIRMDRISSYERALVSMALEQLKGNKKLTIYNSEVEGSTIAFNINGMDSKLVAKVLNEEYGIGTRSGSFCTYELIRKLKGVSPDEDKRIAEEVRAGVTKNIPGLVRASFSIFNRPEDVNRFTTTVKEITERGYDYYEKKYQMNPKTGDWTPLAQAK